VTFAARAGQLTQNPTIKLGPFGNRAVALAARQHAAIELDHVAGQQGGRVETVDIGVDHEEAVDVPET